MFTSRKEGRSYIEIGLKTTGSLCHTKPYLMLQCVKIKPKYTAVSFKLFGPALMSQNGFKRIGDVAFTMTRGGRRAVTKI